KLIPLIPVPLPVEKKSCPSKMPTWRVLVNVLSRLEDVLLPNAVCRIPPAPPLIQKLVPSVVTALRGLLPEAKSFRTVEVSITPAAVTRPTTRGTVFPDVLESVRPLDKLVL